MNEDDWSPPRKRIRYLGTVGSGKFIMFVIDSILMGKVVECIYTIKAIECRTKRLEYTVYAYARKIWEEPDATEWVSQRIVRLFERNDAMNGDGTPEIKMTFKLEKSTKNTHKYEECPEVGQPPRVGSLYVQKWAMSADVPPEKLTVTVAEISEEQQ